MTRAIIKGYIIIKYKTYASSKVYKVILRTLIDKVIRPFYYIYIFDLGK